MRELGITEKGIIFNPKLLTQYAPIDMNVGDLIQILYNNYRVPDNTIYIWNGEEFDYIWNKWNVISVYERGPDYFSEFGYNDLPDLKCEFKEDPDGYVRTSITLADKAYLIECYHKGTRDWAINEGYIKVKYEYCPERDVILAH
jgi:hypothetical protein